MSSGGGGEEGRARDLTLDVQHLSKRGQRQRRQTKLTISSSSIRVCRETDVVDDIVGDGQAWSERQMEGGETGQPASSTRAVKTVERARKGTHQT